MAKKSVVQAENSISNKSASGSASGIIAIRVSRESKRVYVKSRRTPLIFLGLLFVIPWLVLAGVYFGFFSKGGATSNPDPATPQFQIKGGPWGTLDCYSFITDPPDEFLTDDLFPRESEVVWNFGGISRDKLKELFESADLPKETVARLVAAAEFSPDRGCLVKPSDADVLNMSPAARQRLYTELLKNTANQRQVDPFVFKSAQINQWLADATLSPQTVANVKKLLYPHGDDSLLADAAVLLKTVSDAAERRRLLEVLLRRATVMVKLRVLKQPNKDAELANITALTQYWGVGGRESEVRPFIESLQRNPGGMRIDIALLLPRFARDRLYMYPLPASNSLASHRDCHWTALNFFSQTPDDAFADPANVRTELLANYKEIKEAPRLGDIAMFTTPQQKIIHSCVYVAGDVYFSKNGPSQISPWVLMRLEDIHALFPAYENLVVKHFRRVKQ